MINDVITGYDGKRRCGWAGAGDTALGRYHDEVWGTPTHDESAMFEALTLGVFEVGLSWSVVFGKRDAFRNGISGLRRRQGRRDDCRGRRAAGRGRFDHPKPCQDPGDGRQRPRDAVRVAEPGGAREVLRITRKRAPRHVADLPTSTPQAEAFAKQLKSQGYRFVGPTSVYAFMQNVGVVNDHVHGCFRASD